MAATMEAPALRSPVASMEAFDALPVGTTVRIGAATRGEQDWTRVERGWERSGVVVAGEYFSPAVSTGSVIVWGDAAMTAQERQESLMIERRAAPMAAGDIIEYGNYYYYVISPITDSNSEQRFNVAIFNAGTNAYYSTDVLRANFKQRYTDIQCFGPGDLPDRLAIWMQAMSARAVDMTARATAHDGDRRRAEEAQRNTARELERSSARVAALQAQLEQRPATRFPEGFEDRIRDLAREIGDDGLTALLTEHGIESRTEHQVTVRMTGTMEAQVSAAQMATWLGLDQEQIRNVDYTTVSWGKTFTVTRMGVGCVCDEVDEEDDDVQSEVPSNAAEADSEWSIEVSCA